MVTQRMPLLERQQRIRLWQRVGREPTGAAFNFFRSHVGGRVKAAHTTFAVEALLAGAAMVRATPHTGRTHQIRLHMAHAGHPLLGDTRYGGPASYQGRDLAGHLLHAAELRLAHPLTGASLELASPLPELFQELLAAGS
ncbi:MAG: hypothetical protein HGA45_10295 [Chloroflexales bacterium]|nr:hypothetical protein [Chloroflexales bacterium]